MEENTVTSKTRRIVIDFTAGFISGAISTYIGHPLDTLKVRMQVSRVHMSVGKTLRRMIKNEGISGLYKGVVSPILGYAPINAVLFAGNDFGLRMLKHTSLDQESKVFWSGCFGGLVSWFATAPIDLLKVTSQKLTNV